MRVLVFGLLIGTTSLMECYGQPYQATGFKVGEVTDATAIIWTRATAKPKANPANAPTLTFHYKSGKTMSPDLYERPKHPSKSFERIEYSTEGKVRDIRYAAPGIEAETRVTWWDERKDAQKKRTAWQSVDPKADYTRQFKLDSLQPNTRYSLLVETRSPKSEAGQALTGGFRTAPAANDSKKVVFAVSTGQTFRHRDGPHGFDLYDSILKLNPSFFVHTGDIVYYDQLGKTPDLANWHWQRTYSLASNVAFHRQIGSYFIKDDHDTLTNDCWPSMNPTSMFKLTFDKGKEIFRKQVPMDASTYRTIRWGKDLQIWLVEGRDFRSPNKMTDGPEKTIWGKEQMAWFKKSFADSDATFRLLISPTPVVGPDRKSKHDNHANDDFEYEGNKLRDFLSSQKNAFVVCGDRHWQYHSVDPRTGLKEFSCGPASNKHAGGWSQQDFRKDMHRYLNVTGGFLSGTVERGKSEPPTLSFRFHDSTGKLYKEFAFGRQ